MNDIGLNAIQDLGEALVDAHLPPDASLTVFELSRLAVFSVSLERPAEQTLAFLRAAILAEEGAWVDAHFIANLTSQFADTGTATETLAELEAAIDGAVFRRPDSITVRVARARFLIDLDREEEALRDAEAAVEAMTEAAAPQYHAVAVGRSSSK